MSKKLGRCKAILCCLMAAGMAAGVFAGCSSGTSSTASQGSSAASSTDSAASAESDAPEANGETLTFTMMYNDNPAYPFDKNWPALQKIQEVKNVQLDIQAIPQQDYDSKVRILFNSGSIPDIVTYVTQEVYTEFANTGLLLNISEHMDKFPDFQDKIEKYNIEAELENWRTREGDL